MARTIPLDKIQNVELRQNAIQQLVGVVDFRIETAAGPEAEAHLARHKALVAGEPSRIPGKAEIKAAEQSLSEGATERLIEDQYGCVAQ